MLKKIGHEARISFQKVIQQKVDLHLWVRVKENWRDNLGFLNDIGYNNKEI
jgi:GTP-binding protein Era